MLAIKTKPLPYHVSKFQKAAALLSPEECKALFLSLEETLYFYQIGAVVQEVMLSLDQVIEIYRDYMKAIEEGDEPQFFSFGITLDPNTLYMMEVEGGKIAKMQFPTVQMTPHSICYLPELHDFKEKVYGKELIPWGFQCTYPQLFQDPLTHQVHNGLVDFANGGLFRAIQRGLRALAKPTSFITEQGKINTAFRIGGDCLNWRVLYSTLEKINIKIC